MNHRSGIFLSISCALVLSSCSQQPTEMQKAQIEQKFLGCLTAVTTQVGVEEPNIFAGITGLSSKVNSEDGVSTPKWKLLSDEPERVNVTLKLSNTQYSCDYERIDGMEFALKVVQRNGEVVFNFEDDAQAKLKNAKLEEQRKLAEAQKEEFERVEAIKIWKEMSYANVSYKYYIKRHIDDTPNNYSSTKL